MEPSYLQDPTPRGPFARRLLFRLGAVLFGLMLLAACEALLTALDWGRPEIHDDPFVGFRAVRPLFVLNEQGTQYETGPSRLDYFRPQSFAADKPPDEFRVFCLGGSTVQGRPFAVETSFTTWLQISLAAADPDRRWQLVNCGGVSYASYRLVPILEEVLGHRPDLIVLYTGHNEFLEDRTYRHIKHLPAVLSWPCETLARTRTFVAINEGYGRLSGRGTREVSDRRPVLASEVDVMLEYRDGLARYHRDDRWRRDTIDHFRYNIERMVQMARDAGVPLVLMNPVSNLRDCPPFKTQHRDGLSAEELTRWQSLIEEAGRCQGTDARQAVSLLEEARAIDDRHAGLHFLRATCYDALGEIDKARDAYLRAKEEDVCPLRILEPMNEAVLDVARRTRTPLVDVRKFYEQRDEAGIPGSYLLVDHIHPSIAGHQLIANLLADEMVRLGLVRPKPGWESRRDEQYRRHLESLDDFYFSKGQQRLEILRCWTQGKAGRVHGDEGTPADVSR